MKTTAELLTEQMTTPDGRDRRTGHPEAVYTIVMDGTQAHCMTEGMLDSWWNSLPPADKAEIHERWLDADVHSIDQLLGMLRDPLPQIVAAAEQLAASHRDSLTSTIPQPFHPAELAWLRRKPAKQN